MKDLGKIWWLPIPLAAGRMIASVLENLDGTSQYLIYAHTDVVIDQSIDDRKR